MERDIKNKTFAITGGADGIGFQITRNYLKSEAKLAIILDINEENGNKAVKELTTEFRQNKVVFIKCDVTTDLEEIYQKIYNEFGIIDVLINNAGVVDEKIAENCLAVNMTATITWSLKFMDLMRKDAKGNGGTIINIASVFGYRIAQFAPVYNATNFGIVGFTKAVGHLKRYTKKKVRVIAICPGLTRTNLMNDVQNHSDQFYVDIRNSYPWQSAEIVGEKAVEIFKIADGGTLWEIENGELREVK